MKHVLLVDDEDCVRLSLAEFLRSEGYSVETAVTAEEAEDIISRKAPDLLLCDLILPEKSAIQLISSLRRKELNDMKIVVMTGMPSDETENTLRQELRVDAYLPKPFRRSEMFDILNKIYYSN